MKRKRQQERERAIKMADISRKDIEKINRRASILAQNRERRKTIQVNNVDLPALDEAARNSVLNSMADQGVLTASPDKA